MLDFTLTHPRANHEMLGFIPQFLDARDPRSAQEQLHENYSHGGGFSPFNGFELKENGLQYPGDPLTREIARASLREESIRVYENAWVAIVQLDGTHVIARMD